jgi:ATP-dependent helicase HrpA
VDVRSYPALVDRGRAVDRVLLESAEAALVASRAGVRRLLILAAGGAVSSIEPRLPAAFARPNGAMPSRAESEAFRATVLHRIADAAFGLESSIPRDKMAFERTLGAGIPRLAAAFRAFTDAMAPAAAELDKTLKALKSAMKHPSGRHCVLDVYAQLEALFPLDLMEWIPLQRLEQYPRYLRAAQARLSRAVADPRKDADKHAPFAPLWATFLAKQKNPRDPELARALRWTFEELRVAIFAPELKTPEPVSVPKVAAALAAL